MKKTLTSILLGLIHFFVSAQTEFITTWKTDNPGSSADNQITVPIFTGETYNYTVDWGDGNSDTNVTGSITHTYNVPGIYQVSIEGTFPRIYFNESGDKDKILNIKQWGNIQWTSMESAFAGCTNISVGAADAPNLSYVESLRRMFYYCNYLTYDYRNTREFSSFNGVHSFDSWDVSTIKNMSNMFDKCSFNQDISSWDVSNVEDMSYMFFSSRFNKDINSWDVSNVTNMAALFSSGMFNQDISDWDVSNVVNIDFIFNSTYFNHDITRWNVANMVSMRHAFSQGHFDQDLSSWDISNVLDMSNAFDDSDLSRENYDAILIAWSQLPGLKTGVTLGANDAIYCTAENERATLINDYGWTINDYGIDCENEVPFVTTWKTDNPGPSNDNQITIPTSATDIYDYRVDWGDGTFDEEVTGDITHTYAQPGVYEVSITGKFPRIYFYGYEFGPQTSDDLKLLSVDQWGSNRWKSMDFAFAGCENMEITATDIPDFSRGVSLTGMFWDAKSMEGNASIANWDIEKATYMNFMFRGASSFNGSIGEWDVTGKREFYGMFEDAESFDQDLSNWNVQDMENMTNLFKGSGLSNTNYDKILIGWSQLPSLKSGVQLGAPDNYYCSAADERQYLIGTYGWTIIDGGKVPFCNEDNDADEVLDHLDLCLNTRPDAVVDDYGCEIIPVDAIQVYVLTPSCVDSADGAVNILMNVPGHLMDISISGDSYSNQFDDVASEQEFQIGGLAPGTYSISITVPENLFEQTVGITINSLSSITGKRASTDSKNGTVLYEVAGSKNYDVLINGEKKSYSFENTGRQNILIENLYGQSEVSISGENACQGIVSDSFFIGDAIQVYPTITSSQVNIMTNKSVINTMVFGLDGRLVRVINFDQNNKSIDVSTLKSGVYFLQMEVEGHRETVKIVKR